jgi:hypothetical protein
MSRNPTEALGVISRGRAASARTFSPEEAMAVAVAMITARLRLHAGDTVEVRRANDAPNPTKGELF